MAARRESEGYDAYARNHIALLSAVHAFVGLHMFRFDTSVYDSNPDLFSPADELMFVNQRGIAKGNSPSQAGTTCPGHLR